MHANRNRWAWLIVLSSGTLFMSTCDAVLNTIALGFNIADIWV